MNYFRGLAFLGLALAATAVPALARDSFVLDQAGLFAASTVSNLNAKITKFNADTGKEVVVMTVPSLDGNDIVSAGQRAFAQQQVDGVLIFIASQDHKDVIVPDRAGQTYFSHETLSSIRAPMESAFRNNDFDGGITGAVDSTLGVYRAHRGALAGGRAGAGAIGAASAGRTRAATQPGGMRMSPFVWILIIFVGFMIVRSLMRAAAGPRMYPPAYGPGGPAPGQAYGPGYGGGGGGSFWSGLLGGLGGAFIGNQMFGGREGGGSAADAGSFGGADTGGALGGGGDASGWQSDAGQADMGGASSGDWGGGGGFDAGGGDGGGGGGDSGGW